MNCQTKRYFRLALSRRMINGRRLSYELLRSGERSSLYLIGISFRGETVWRSITCDSSKAMDIYSRFVKNSVTPCTLDDIIEDMGLKIF